MKQVFQMKTMLLSALLCVIGFGSKAQMVDVFNNTLCTTVVRFYAVDPATCKIIATDPGPYFIPAGAPPPTTVPIAWVPAPAISYVVVTEVADAACGFPGVLVGGVCAYPPSAPVPPCPSCAPSIVDGPSPVFAPGSGGVHYPVNIHP